MLQENLVYRVVGWDSRYETPRSLKQKGPQLELRVDSNLNQVMPQKLMRTPVGASLMGVWYLIQLLAANGDRRGVLCERGMPLAGPELARLTGWDVPLIDQALEILCSDDFKLIEQVPIETALQPPVVPEPPPRAPRKRKPLPFTHCPVCDANLVEIAQKLEASRGHQPGACGCTGANHACQDSAPSDPRTKVSEVKPVTDETKRANGQVRGEANVADAASVQSRSGEPSQIRALCETNFNQSRRQVPVSSPHLSLNPAKAFHTDNRLPPGRKKRKAEFLKRKQELAAT